MKQRKETKDGITLIALIITIIILLILAGISINTITGDNGLLNRANIASRKYKMEQSKEKLNITLASASGEKKINYEYNQDDFLDNLIEKEIEDAEILGDAVIVDGYVFELDRSVPKIKDYLGQKNELKFPEITLSVTSPLSPTVRDKAKITITSIEKEKGINKIEIIRNGIVVKEYSYDNVKEQITEEYIVEQNGKYIVKSYSDLEVSAKVEVSGLLTMIKYNPSGSTEYKQKHTVQVNVSGEKGKVKNIKYQWLNTTNAPAPTTFSESCNNGVSITKDKVTGKWYLWILVETETGEVFVERSEAFYFDNQGPEVSLKSAPVAVKKFKLSAMAKDDLTTIESYKFYVDGVLKNTIPSSAEEAGLEVTLSENKEVNCYVIVEDKLGNSTKVDVIGKPEKYIWDVYNTIVTSTYYTEKKTRLTRSVGMYDGAFYVGNDVITFNSTNGTWYKGLKGANTIRDGWNNPGMIVWTDGVQRGSQSGTFNDLRYGIMISCQKTSSNVYLVVYDQITGKEKHETRSKTGDVVGREVSYDVRCFSGCRCNGC